MGIFGSVIRHLLTAASGGLIVVGVSEEQTQDFVHAAEPLVSGIALYLVGQVWSIFDKKKNYPFKR